MRHQKSAPSLKDIATAAGVSVMTASNVLRTDAGTGSRKLFSEATQKKVLGAARSLGYVPNRAARSMRTQRTGVIGFVASNFSKEDRVVDNYAVHPFLVGLNHVLAPTGRHVALVELDEMELRSGSLPLAMQERFFDALVVHYGLARQSLHALDQSRIPVVYWDSGQFSTANCVYRDELAVGRAVTERLLELGHERIAFHTGSGHNWTRYRDGEFVHFSFAQRYEGYAWVLRSANLPVLRVKGYDPAALSRQIMEKEITAVISSTILPFVRAVALQGKQLPDALSILSCDVEGGVFNRNAIGGAIYNRYEAGRIAADMIIRRLESSGVDAPNVVLPVEMTDASTAVPRMKPLRGTARKASS